MSSRDLVQGTKEWRLARLGKVTASRISDVAARTKSGWGSSRANYMAELICERLTGAPAEHFQSREMMHGLETEPLARAAYQFYTDDEVVAVGFFDHPTIPMSGASPDGVVPSSPEAGLVEFKCPNTATHIDTLLGEPVAGKYVAQMQWLMACTRRKWCDFVSFDPRMPGELRLFVKRFARDDLAIATLEKEVRIFLAETDTKVAILTGRLLKVA